ncbi:hypothetical protein EBOKLHFM_00104 [Klebsiella phage KP13-26]|uniref:Uncharacterized protein n=1 Tax=Klebsiella phage FKP3 TaxID=3231233 RepID=A0AAU8HZI8_9CAUD|nr:hypothetical protein EBOKLHFM_00104 [Klebsiella phage KP13-26]
MIEFEDASIISELVVEEGGAVDFVSNDGSLKKGYSIFVKSEESGDIFELVLSELELKTMLKQIKEEL